MFAYFILRVFVGVILIVFGIKHIRFRTLLKESLNFPFFPFPTFIVWYLALWELLLGVMFVTGFYTQIAALLTIGMAFKIIIWRKRFKTDLIQSRTFYALLLGCALSLFITGAGVLGFDLPI